MVGDFVLIRRAQDKGHKQSFRRIGPPRVVKVVGELVSDVEIILLKKIERVHAARIILYRSDMDGKEVPPELLEHAEHSERKYELVDEIVDISGNGRNGIFVQVSWAGLPEREDWTRQPLDELYEGLPDQVEAFLQKPRKSRGETSKVYPWAEHLMPYLQQAMGRCGHFWLGVWVWRATGVTGKHSF